MSPKLSWLNSAVLIGALGYFVDVYDLILFSVVRTQSLKDLNVPAEQLLDVGVRLINWQMSGLLLGGILGGIWGDKKGRVSVLFGSILLYSIANLLNAFVQTPGQYSILRFLAGFGLAAELGAAVTLVSETLTPPSRGYGTTIVAGLGLWGAVLACVLGDYLPWRVLYLIGGVMGLALLGLRWRLTESPLFAKFKQSQLAGGEFGLLFLNKNRILKFVYCTGIGIPIYFVVGLLIIFSPELAEAQGAKEPISAGRSILYYYIGLSVGDVASGLISQWLGSRKKVVGMFLALSVVGVGLVSRSADYTASYFYALSLGLGFATGYWALFVTISAEQFGTNLRATVTTSTPSLVRGSLVLMTIVFQALRFQFGLVSSLSFIGIAAFSIATYSLIQLRETYGIDLDYVEG